MSFASNVVIVTGASDGIGAATAIKFAKEGADVTLVGRTEDKLAKIAAECGKHGKNPLVIKADVSKDEEAKTIVARTIQTFGRLDILVNNAGILFADDIMKPNFMETFDSTMNTNMRAVALITHLAVPHLVETKGNVINVSSIAASMIKYPNIVSYKTSKAALNHFTRCLALELAPHGVRVNSVSPGPVYTDIFNKAGLSDFVPDLKKATALKRIAEPHEIADVIIFLASEKARSVTGSDYLSDNGSLLM
ncbi:glucose 1-dehydrogenase [Manduca sexta]|uniref:glucose 1-dehydrogenase n=1 Tax=Manduca sexta TaxID=7130 RepID=UPI00188DD397|nr:glucose 1-dehydrogenase [Manduca sexta]